MNRSQKTTGEGEKREDGKKRGIRKEMGGRGSRGSRGSRGRGGRKGGRDGEKGVEEGGWGERLERGWEQRMGQGKRLYEEENARLLQPSFIPSHAFPGVFDEIDLLPIWEKIENRRKRGGREVRKIKM